MERGARTAETRTSTWSWSMITQTRWRSRNIERSDHGDFFLPGMETRASHEDRQSWSWSGCGLYVDVKQRRQQILDIVQRKGSQSHTHIQFISENSKLLERKIFTHICIIYSPSTQFNM